MALRAGSKEDVEHSTQVLLSCQAGSFCENAEMPPVPGTRHPSELFQRRNCLHTWVDFSIDDGNVLRSDIVGPKRVSTCSVQVWSVVSVGHVA